MAFDPNIPNDVKQSLKNNRPQNLNNDWFGQATKALQEQTGSSSLGGGYVPMHPATAPVDNTSAAPTPVAQRPAVVVSTPNAPVDAASLRPAGMTALPAGFVRSPESDAIGYNVYEGRQKNGVPIFTDNPGAAAKTAGLKAHARAFAGTQVDPRTQITDMAGWTQGPGVAAMPAGDAGSAVDTSYGANAPAVQRMRYAENSLHMNPSDMIRAAGVNPEAAQQAQEQLIASMNNDPNSQNPEVAAANRAALAQLQGNVQDVRQQYWGSNGGMYGAMSAGGAGGTGGGRGLGLKAILENHYRNANLGERAARDQATQQYREQMADRADRAEARQGAQYFMTNYQNAETKAPGSGDALIAQTTPQGMSQDEFKKWVTTNPSGQAWSQALLQSMQRGAAESLKTPFGIPVEWGDRANLASNVNFGNMKLDKTGNFAGFLDNSGSPTNEYPRRSGLWGSPNYNESLLRTISPAYWKVLQQVGLRRSQPASG